MPLLFFPTLKEKSHSPQSGPRLSQPRKRTKHLSKIILQISSHQVNTFFLRRQPRNKNPQKDHSYCGPHVVRDARQISISDNHKQVTIIGEKCANKNPQKNHPHCGSKLVQPTCMPFEDRTQRSSTIPIRN